VVSYMRARNTIIACFTSKVHVALISHRKISTQIFLYWSSLLEYFGLQTPLEKFVKKGSQTITKQSSPTSILND